MKYLSLLQILLVISVGLDKKSVSAFRPSLQGRFLVSKRSASVSPSLPDDEKDDNDTNVFAKQSSEESSNHDFLLHRGVTATFMPKWPAIVTYTAVRGWTDETTAKFQKAVEKVLQLNPILTGRVYQRRPYPFFHPQRNQVELYVEPGYFFGKEEEHDFVSIVSAPEDMPTLQGMNCTQALQLVQETIIPFMDIRCESTGENIRSKTPLFTAKVLRFPDDTACYAIKMSHCLGDGLTFYYIVDQIMHFLNQDDTSTDESAVLPTLINWNHPQKATFECFPPSFSTRDRTKAYGWPFYVGLFRNFRRLIHPTYKQLLVLSRDKIEQVKADYLQQCPPGTRISANDLITAGLCQSCHSTDIFSFPLNMRGRQENLMDRMAAGYLCCEIPFCRKAALEPLGMREIVTRGQYYETDQLPLKPYLQGRNGRISNFASVGSTDVFVTTGASGVETICQGMPVNFFEIFPIDVCMIFAVDAQHLGVMHNFDDFAPNELLDQMTVFKLEPPPEQQDE